MRWSYLIPRLIIVGLIWAFFAFGFDPALRYGATESLQTITGAKADINELSTGFFPPRMAVRNVALASQKKPGTNLLQFDAMNLSLAGGPLLRRSYVVDEAEVTGVRFGTSRNDNGQLALPPDEESGPAVPPWLTDKLKNVGDEWLEEFTQQAKGQLDPNTLESYRVGNELYVKWDRQFEQFNIRIQTTKSQLDTMKEQLELAKKGKSLEQVEQYLQIAQRADLLMRQSRHTFDQFRHDVPLQLRQDFARLNQAQKNDRANVAAKIRLLKPDPRRITESLIGEELYVQLQQMLSWVETLRGYQEELKGPPPQERYRGHDIEFELLHPTPKVLCKKMLINGELMLSDLPTPFEAVLTDVTSDPKLHGRPALLQVSTAGETPMQLVVRHDATGDVATTYLAADYTDANVQQLSAGKVGKDQLVASLRDIRWQSRLTLVEGRISGRIDVRSKFGESEIKTNNKVAMALTGLAEQTLNGITEVNAALHLDGTIRQPNISVESDLGPQIANSFQTAFTSFGPQLQAQLMTVVDNYVAEQKQSFSKKLGGRYETLLADHGKILDQLNEARQLAMNLKSGQVDPNRMFKLASETGVLKGKDKQKAEKYLGKGNKYLNGLQNPEQTIQNALPGLRKKLFR